MNLNNWISQAREHWKEHQPAKFKELQRTGKLGLALKEAAERTHAEMTELENQGMANHEAWEMVRETYLFPKEEAPQAEEPSQFASLFNEAMAIRSEMAEAEE